MNQLPIFVNLYGRKVILVGEGEAAQAKRRLIERAGGVCVGVGDRDARLAFVACDDFADTAAALKLRGLLVNVVDQPDHCDFTTPAIVDRSPVLVAIGTGGTSAGLAKALRQRLEDLLPNTLGQLAIRLNQARDALRAKWPDGPARRKAIDAALSECAVLDPLRETDDAAFSDWLGSEAAVSGNQFISVCLRSTDPDDLSIREARYLGQADHIYASADIPDSILNRARADAIRHRSAPPDVKPDGLVVHLSMARDAIKGAA